MTMVSFGNVGSNSEPRIVVYDYNACGVFTSEVIHTGMEQLILGKPKWYTIAFILGIKPKSSKQLRVSI